MGRSYIPCIMLFIVGGGFLTQVLKEGLKTAYEGILSRPNKPPIIRSERPIVFWCWLIPVGLVGLLGAAMIYWGILMWIQGGAEMGSD